MGLTSKLENMPTFLKIFPSHRQNCYELWMRTFFGGKITSWTWSPSLWLCFWSLCCIVTFCNFSLLQNLCSLEWISFFKCSNVLGNLVYMVCHSQRTNTHKCNMENGWWVFGILRKLKKELQHLCYSTQRNTLHF